MTDQIRNKKCSSCGDPCSGGLKCRYGDHPLCIPCSIKEERFKECRACRAEIEAEIKHLEEVNRPFRRPARG